MRTNREKPQHIENFSMMIMILVYNLTKISKFVIMLKIKLNQKEITMKI